MIISKNVQKIRFYFKYSFVTDINKRIKMLIKNCFCLNICEDLSKFK